MQASLYFFLVAFFVVLGKAAVVEQGDTLRRSLLRILASRNVPKSSNTKRFEFLESRNLNHGGTHFAMPGMNPQLISLILDYIPSNEIQEASSVCVDFYNAANELFLSKISRIFPDIPQDRPLPVALIKFFIEQGFETDLNPDALEKLTFNYLLEDLNSRLSKNINWHIFSFLHDYFYGPDAIVPGTVTDWRSSFVTKLQRGDLNFDETLKFYVNSFIDKIANDNNITGYAEFIHQCKHTMCYFYVRTESFPLKELSGLFGLFDLERQMEKENFGEVFFGLHIRVAETVGVRHRFSNIVFDFMLGNKTFSQKFWDIISGFDDLLFPYFENRSSRTSYRWNKELVKKFLGPSINGLEYLLTRDSLNPFDLQLLLAMNVDMTVLMTEFLYCATPTLTEIEIFTQVVNAGLLPLELVDQAKSHTSGVFSRILDSILA